MNIPEQLKAANVDLRSLVPTGKLLSVREEWLCELPPFSHRWKIQVATTMRDCVTSFCNAAPELGAKAEKWGPQRACARATDNQGRWAVVLADVSTDALPMVLAAFDFRMLPESECVEGAVRFAKQQKELVSLAPLWNELSLPIIMASFERSHDGGVRGYVQLAVDDVRWPEVQRWLEAQCFHPKTKDEWIHQEQSKLFVLRSPGKIWASLE